VSLEHWTRDDLVTVAMALEEFRDEYGPGRRDLADRVNAVLRGPGERFAIVPVDEDA
jgi:hypothetical protein